MVAMKKRGVSVMQRWIAACCISLSLLFASLQAQCEVLEEIGFIFLHPYFKNLNWISTVYESEIEFPPDILCNDRPVQFSVSHDVSKGTVVYTTSEEKWMMFNMSLHLNDCVCCRPGITFEEPVEITEPSTLSATPSIPFYILDRGSADTDTAYVVIAADADNRVYCLHMSMLSGKTGAVDTITVTAGENQKISGIWGITGSSGDSAVLIGGSNGLVRRVPFSSGTWGTVQEMTLENGDEETVSCAGDGYLGTVSGKVFYRSGTTYKLSGSVASAPLRYISGRCAVGDNGTILVNNGSEWKSHSKGDTDYRYGSLTAGPGGTMIQLVDVAWNYTERTLFETNSAITSIDPKIAYESLNKAPILFEESGIVTVNIKVDDKDGNRQLPLIKVRGNTLEYRNSDKDTLLPQNPSAVCTTSQAFFDDSVFKLIVDYNSITFEARAKQGTVDNVCKYWEWKPLTFSVEAAWSKDDTLIMTYNDDVLRVVNKADSIPTVASAIFPPQIKNDNILIRQNGRNLSIQSGIASEVTSITLIDAAGRQLVQRKIVSGRAGVTFSSKIPAGIHFLRIHYRNGMSEIRRIVITGR